MTKRAAILSPALVGMALLVAFLYVAVASFALEPAAYPQTSPFGEMAGELAAYLAGDLPTLSPALFTEQERLHMEDVLALFEGGQRVAERCLIVAGVLGIMTLAAGGRRLLGKGLLLGMGVFFAAALGLIVWAAIDFDGWFRAMHELVFTNDLWLLDPAESMLIRMLPLNFFIHAVQVILLRFAAGAAMLLTVACMLWRLPRKKEGSA